MCVCVCVCLCVCVCVCVCVCLCVCVTMFICGAVLVVTVLFRKLLVCCSFTSHLFWGRLHDCVSVSCCLSLAGRQSLGTAFAVPAAEHSVTKNHSRCWRIYCLFSWLIVCARGVSFFSIFFCFFFFFSFSFSRVFLWLPLFLSVCCWHKTSVQYYWPFWEEQKVCTDVLSVAALVHTWRTDFRWHIQSQINIASLSVKEN